MVSKRLNSGVQFKSTLYGDDIALQAGTFNTYYTKEDLVRDIPKYRNDPTATGRMANLHQSRTSDKLLLRGFKVNIGINNGSSYTTHVRFVIIRSKAYEEIPATNATNWCKSLDGSATSPSGELQTALTERFNYDLCASRKDMLCDRRFILGATASLDRSQVRRQSFWIPCNHTCIFESKGDSSSADDLKTGRYTLMIWTANSQETNGGYTSVHYDINAIWAQA